MVDFVTKLMITLSQPKIFCREIDENRPSCVHIITSKALKELSQYK
jgi:hypothetical protein